MIGPLVLVKLKKKYIIPDELVFFAPLFDCGGEAGIV
jgi:hypothetical protein